MIKYVTSESDNQVIIQLIGDLDIDSTEVVEEQIKPLLEKYEDIIMDFNQVPFVDSSGLGILMNLVLALQEGAIRVKICNVTPNVLEVFEMLQLSAILGEEVFA